jgi:hypothetical protein
MEAGAPEARPQTLQFKRWPREEERGSKFLDSGMDAVLHISRRKNV